MSGPFRSERPFGAPLSENHAIEPRRDGSVIESSPAEDSTHDVTHEDFLFHLYRGSELLQDGRLLEAKEELEYALTMQPLDAKGQDLLGTVCFRLGLYPRAIQIYEMLEKQFERDVSIKINLALCHLKSGEAARARRPLEDAVMLDPEHKRAWGYLGLALQRLGEVGQAQMAFERGGHPLMARRLTDRRPRGTTPAPVVVSAEAAAGVRDAAEVAFSELDAGELRFSLAEPQSSKVGEGSWRTLELGQASVSHPSPAIDGAAGAPSLLVLPPDRRVAIHTAGVLLVQTGEQPAEAFAGRLDALRAIAGTVTTRVLHRRIRDADTSELLGGIGSPLVRIAGDAQLVLGARPGHALFLLSLADDLAFVREDVLMGFELRLLYENGRVALAPTTEGSPASTDRVAVVQLRGRGALVLELSGSLASIPTAAGRPLVVRREWIVGWLGRLVTRAVPPAESPSGQRGLVGFSGDGTVLVCPA